MENLESIFNEAKECLSCKKPTCIKGCPVYTNIPEFINKIKNNKLDEAYQILMQNNIMSKICSLVCPTQNQCMGNCIKAIKGNPVNISKLELFVNKWAKENNINYSIIPSESNHIKVAVVGGGPAGIACAVELKIKGYDVTIFEKEEKIGGILEYQIPDFRLDKKEMSFLKKQLSDLNIKITYKSEFGKNITINSLQKEGFKAIFLGVGASISNKYSITDKKCKNIIVAKDILNQYYKNELIKNIGKTIVIGGGNVAIDAARVANKMGAESVTIIYRRNKELMPAIKEEVNEAIDEGVNFIYNTKVISAQIDANEKLTKVECVKTEVVDNKIKDIKGSNFWVPADTVIFAIGSKIDEEFFKTMDIDIENGLTKIDENGMTNIDGIFAGGDVVEIKPTVCKAIATGKKAADGINKYLSNYCQKIIYLYKKQRRSDNK